MNITLQINKILNRIAAFFRAVSHPFLAFSRDHYFSEHDISKLYRALQPSARPGIDDQTWRDLLLADYSSILSHQTSIFGKQMIYCRLRLGQTIDQHTAQKRALLFLIADQERLKTLHAVCQHLRRVDTEIAAMLFDTVKLPSPPKWRAYAKIIPFALIVSICLVVYGLAISSVTAITTTAFFCIFPITILLFGIQLQYRETIRHWNQMMYSLTQMLGTSSLFGAREETFFQEFSDHRKQCSKLVSQFSRIPLSVPALERVRDYYDWFFMSNVFHYFQQQERVEENRDFLRASTLRCANLEADIALARHLLTREQFCWPTLHEQASFHLQDAVHPLLENAMPLSIASAGKSIVLSGQNGIGKSTLLRTIGINLIVARAFGFCYAAAADSPISPVYASLQNEDSLLNGESLYVSELRRARELLETIEEDEKRSSPAPEKTGKYGIYIIDEIFRGTNYLESISASAAVLQRLASHATVIVSSHNLVLAAILHANFTAKYVNKEEDGTLMICDGVLPKTNGIALLASHGFNSEIEDDANKVFQWLSQYLSHPTEDVNIFTS